MWPLSIFLSPLLLTLLTWRNGGSRERERKRKSIIIPLTRSLGYCYLYQHSKSKFYFFFLFISFPLLFPSLFLGILFYDFGQPQDSYLLLFMTFPSLHLFFPVLPFNLFLPPPFFRSLCPSCLHYSIQEEMSFQKCCSRCFQKTRREKRRERKKEARKEKEERRRKRRSRSANRIRHVWYFPSCHFLPFSSPHLPFSHLVV